jgi:hypothetical protein
MTSSTPLDFKPLAKPVRRARRTVDEEGLEKKPKKVNSEVRKQQNRIASRNYRTLCPTQSSHAPYSTNMLFVAGEKRKRKLQYLQQLIKDESNDEQTPYTSPQQHEAHVRNHSADHDVAPSSSAFTLPSSNHFVTLSTSSTFVLGSEPATGASTYDSGLLPITQSFSPFEQRWSSPMHETPSPSSMAFMPVWMSSIEYSPRLAHHFLPPVGQDVSAQAASPYHPSRDLLPNHDPYIIGLQYEHYSGTEDHTPGVSSVSLPTSTSYIQGHYPGQH